MSKPSYFDIIHFDHIISQAQVLTLINAGVYSASDLAMNCRQIADLASPGTVRGMILFFAATLESTNGEASSPPAPLWSPTVIMGGKDDDDTAG